MTSRNIVTLFPSTPEGVFVCLIDDGKEARFTPTFFKEFNAALDTVESHDGPTALVIIGGEKSKFFSNGFDIAWLKGPAGHDAINVGAHIQ